MVFPSNIKNWNFKQEECITFENYTNSKYVVESKKYKTRSTYFVCKIQYLRLSCLKNINIRIRNYKN